MEMIRALEILGCALLWIAASVGRKEDSQIKGRNFWLIMLLLVIGVSLINNAEQIGGWLNF